MNQIQRAIDIVGGISQLARLLDVTPQAVRFWRAGERRIPAEVCPVIERATERRVTCEQLCPKVDWAYIREGDAAAAEDSKPNQPPTPAHQALAAINSETEQGAAHA